MTVEVEGGRLQADVHRMVIPKWASKTPRIADLVHLHRRGAEIIG